MFFWSLSIIFGLRFRAPCNLHSAQAWPHSAARKLSSGVMQGPQLPSRRRDRQGSWIVAAAHLAADPEKQKPAQMVAPVRTLLSSPAQGHRPGGGFCIRHWHLNMTSIRGKFRRAGGMSTDVMASSSPLCARLADTPGAVVIDSDAAPQSVPVDQRLPTNLRTERRESPRAARWVH